MIDKSIREIERERQGLQNQEKKLIVDIKKTAKQGQMVRQFLDRLCFLFFSCMCWVQIINVRKKILSPK